MGELVVDPRFLSAAVPVALVVLFYGWKESRRQLRFYRVRREKAAVPAGTPAPHVPSKVSFIGIGELQARKAIVPAPVAAGSGAMSSSLEDDLRSGLIRDARQRRN